MRSMQLKQICMMRELSALCKFWCSLSMLWLDDLMSTSFQIDEFITHCFFQLYFIACYSAFFSDLKIWFHQFFTHCICFSSVMRFLLTLSWQRHFWIFSHVFLIISFMSDFLCCWWKLASLVFRYRSSRKMCVSVSRTVISVILYALTMTCRHLFCILINFLINLFL